MNYKEPNNSSVATNFDRRQFLKVTTLAGGGLLIGFNWSNALSSTNKESETSFEWHEINAYLKISTSGIVTIVSPNPEMGQNIKTSMPMIIAEELDIDWKDVRVEQGQLSTQSFAEQFSAGSEGIKNSWMPLRKIGATARFLLVKAASQHWKVDMTLLKTHKGKVHFNDLSLSYGDLASQCAQITPPKEISLKPFDDFTIIGNGKRNVAHQDILNGLPIYGIDVFKEGMAYAVIERPPFGAILKSYDDTQAKKSNGVIDVFQLGEKVVVLADSTWHAFKARKALKIEWAVKGRMEDSNYLETSINAVLNGSNTNIIREDGNLNKALAEGDFTIERTYSFPFLPHNTMEPLNFYADISDDHAIIEGPTQRPEWCRNDVAKLLGRKTSEVTLTMTRMGGGFGRKARTDYVVEAAEISWKAKRPVQLIFSREDDIKAGMYRPIIKFKYQASIKSGKMTGLGYRSSSPYYGKYGAREDKFPAGALPNFRCESIGSKTNIQGGIWRGPLLNCLAIAEQCFLDEVAEKTNQDAIEFRLRLLKDVKNNPVGKYDYDPDRFIKTLNLVRQVSDWEISNGNVSQGISMYYGFSTYAAVVVDVILQDRIPVIQKVHIAVDCGIVINPLAATNQVEGGVIDAVGHCMYGDLSFDKGRAQETNFDKYHLIRMREAPEVIVHFVPSSEYPSGLGEPPFLPVGAAVANAIAKATGKRVYKTPFIKNEEIFSEN
jgi:isoquinoline 1-oxidoreductase beta subunit